MRLVGGEPETRRFTGTSGSPSCSEQAHRLREKLGELETKATTS